MATSALLNPESSNGNPQPTGTMIGDPIGSIADKNKHTNDGGSDNNSDERRTLYFRYSSHAHGWGSRVGRVAQSISKPDLEALLVRENTVLPLLGPGTEAEQKPFSDYPLYRKLRQERGCVQVEIARIVCHYSRSALGSQIVFRGIQVIYRSTLRPHRSATAATTLTTENSGAVVEKETMGPLHSFSSGYHFYSGRKPERHTIVVDPNRQGEYLVGICVVQGFQVVHGMTFVTNTGRKIHAGERPIPHMAPTTRHAAHFIHARLLPGSTYHRILAFCGTGKRGGLYRIGYVSESLVWERLVGPLVMGRRLVAEQRAILRLDHARVDTDDNDEEEEDSDAHECCKSTKPASITETERFGSSEYKRKVIQGLIRIESDEVLREIVSFLLSRRSTAM